MIRTYTRTLVGDQPWSRLSPAGRHAFVYGMWLITWGLLLLGFTNPVYWHLLMVVSVAHALFVWGMCGYNALAFPAQLRLAHSVWLALGMFVPALYSMMVITTIGLSAFLVFDYCPLARLLTLLPWNRTYRLTGHTFVRLFTQRPAPGRITLTEPIAS